MPLEAERRRGNLRLGLLEQFRGEDVRFSLQRSPLSEPKFLGPAVDRCVVALRT